MTYVAQFVRHCNDTNDNAGVPQVDDDTILYEDIMAWLSERNEELKEVHKRRKYQTQDFHSNQKLRFELPPKIEQVNKLRERFDCGKLSTISKEQLETLENLCEKVVESNKKWHVALDSSLPGQLGRFGVWLHQAEDHVINSSTSSDADDVTDDETAAELIHKKIVKHQEMFKDIEQMTQLFVKGKRSSKFSGKKISEEQLEELTKRLENVKVTSQRRHCELEIKETKRKLEINLKKAEKKLAIWNRKHKTERAVDDVIIDYKKCVEDEGLMKEIETLVAKLQETGKRLMQMEIGDEEEKDLQELISDKEEQAKAICGEVGDVMTSLNQLSNHWKSYNENLAKVLPWLQKSSEIIEGNQTIDKKDFLRELPQYKKAFEELQCSAQFLIENCDSDVADDVINAMSGVNDQAESVFSGCEDLIRSQVAEEQLEMLEVEMEDLENDLKQIEDFYGLETPLNQLINRIEGVENSQKKIEEIEKSLKRIRTEAQHLSSDDVSNHVMPRINDVINRVNRIQEVAEEEMKRCEDLQQPISEIEDDLEVMTSQVEKIERKIEDLKSSDEDVETKHQKHEELIRNLGSLQNDLKNIIGRVDVIRDSYTNVSVNELDDVINMTSSRLEQVLSEANILRPRLAEGAMAVRDFRTSVAEMEAWMTSSKNAITGDDVRSRTIAERLEAHQEILDSVGDSPISKLVSAAEQIRKSYGCHGDDVTERTSQIQREYKTLLKTANQSLLHLRLEEAETEYLQIMTSSRDYLQQVAMAAPRDDDVTTDELIEQHEERMNEPLLRVCYLLEKMEDLCQRFEDEEDQKIIMKKIEKFRQDYERILAEEEQTRGRLQQLPQMLQDFEQGIRKLKTWTNSMETAMKKIHGDIQPDVDVFQKIRGNFEKLLYEEGELRFEIENLQRLLDQMMNYISRDKLQQMKDELLLWNGNIKSLINASSLSKKQIVELEKCFQFHFAAEETLKLIEDKMNNFKDLIEKQRTNKISNQEDASSIVSSLQV